MAPDVDAYDRCRAAVLVFRADLGAVRQALAGLTTAADAAANMADVAAVPEAEDAFRSNLADKLDAVDLPLRHAAFLLTQATETLGVPTEPLPATIADISDRLGDFMASYGFLRQELADLAAASGAVQAMALPEGDLDVLHADMGRMLGELRTWSKQLGRSLAQARSRGRAQSAQDGPGGRR